MVIQLLDQAGLKVEEVGLYIFHQANRFILEHLQRKLNIPPERFWIDLENTGNTVSVSLPLALEAALRNGRVRRGDRFMLVGFGVGYSWGACLVKW